MSEARYITKLPAPRRCSNIAGQQPWQVGRAPQANAPPQGRESSTGAHDDTKSSNNNSPSSPGNADQAEWTMGRTGLHQQEMVDTSE